MKSLKIMTLIITVIIMSASCNKDTTPPNTQASEYFPNTVGDKWIYNVYDSIAAKMEEVSLEITGTTTLPKGEVANIWVYTYPNKTDTNFVFQMGDTVKFIRSSDLNPDYYVIRKKYII